MKMLAAVFFSVSEQGALHSHFVFISTAPS